MVKLLWSIVCRESVIDQESKTLSLQGVFEGFNVEVKKNIPQGTDVIIPVDYEIITTLRKESKSKEEKVSLRVRLFDPAGLELIEPLTVPIKMPKGKYNYRQRVKNFGLKVTESGEYRFVIEIKQENSNNFEQMAELPINISIKHK